MIVEKPLPNIRVNGHSLHVSLKEFKLILLRIQEPHINVQSLDQLQENFSVMFACIKDFCERTYFRSKGKGRSELTREMRAMDNEIRRWNFMKTREKFVKSFYNWLLRLEGLDTKTK